MQDTQDSTIILSKTGCMSDWSLFTQTGNHILLTDYYSSRQDDQDYHKVNLNSDNKILLVKFSSQTDKP